MARRACVALVVLLLYHVAVVHAGKDAKMKSDERIAKQAAVLKRTQQRSKTESDNQKAVMKQKRSAMKKKQDAFRALKKKQLDDLNSMNTNNAKNVRDKAFATLGYPQGVRGE